MRTPPEVACSVRNAFFCVSGKMTHIFLGGIFGTGTNGAYVERVENIKKLGDSPARQKGGYMVVNTEWGAFNNTVGGDRFRLCMCF